MRIDEIRTKNQDLTSNKQRRTKKKELTKDHEIIKKIIKG